MRVVELGCRKHCCGFCLALGVNKYEWDIELEVRGD